MTSIVRDAVAADLAALTRVVPSPTGALGYGSDLAMTVDGIDIDADMLERLGSDPLVLAEALVRRLDCPRGALPDDPDYGLDVRGYLNRGTTTAEIRGLSSAVHAEVTKDDRVGTARVVVDPSLDGSSLAITIQITPADPSLEPFELVLAVTTAAVLIEEIRQ